MDKDREKQQKMHERAAYRYLEALETRDIDELIEVLQLATYDAELEKVVLDIHQSYFQEEQDRERPGVDQQTLIEIPALGQPASKMLRRRPQRRPARPMQILAAILVIGVLVSGFLIALHAERTNTGSGPSLTPTIQSTAPAWPCTSFAWFESVPGPDPGFMTSVTAFSPVDAWAVGGLTSVGGVHRNAGLVEHWDGQKWTRSLVTPDSAVLEGVTALSANDVWAVGSQSTQGPGELLIEHWNGEHWSVEDNPVIPGNVLAILYSVTANAADDVWAAGILTTQSQQQFPLLEHWNGQTWSIVTGATPSTTTGWLTNIKAAGTNSVFASGYTTGSDGISSHPLLEHWNGQTWQLMDTASLGANAYTVASISVVSAQNIWTIVGYRTSSSGPAWSQVEHWDGQTWSTISTGNATDDKSFTKVIALSSTDIWLFGQTTSQGQKQIFLLHGDGKTWKQMAAPSGQAVAANIFTGIAVSSNSIWLVGQKQQGSGTQPLLILQSICHK